MTVINNILNIQWNKKKKFADLKKKKLTSFFFISLLFRFASFVMGIFFGASATAVIGFRTFSIFFAPRSWPGGVHCIFNFFSSRSFLILHKEIFLSCSAIISNHHSLGGFPFSWMLAFEGKNFSNWILLGIYCEDTVGFLELSWRILRPYWLWRRIKKMKSRLKRTWSQSQTL